MSAANDQPELPNPPLGRIAPGSALDTRDQARLYRELMGREATIRQVGLVRRAKARELADRKRWGPKGKR